MYGPCFSSIVGGHPLRSPNRHSLGRPLPYQQADGTQAPPKAEQAPLIIRPLILMTTWGISNSFELLSLSLGQVTNALLTRSPLRNSTYCYIELSVRLACIRHAANVHPEPGSNSPQKKLSPNKVFRFLLADMLDLSRSTFIDEVCHLPITLQLLRCYLSPQEPYPTQHKRLCQAFCLLFRQKCRCFLANTGRSI